MDEIRRRASNVRMIVMDVDGVMTDRRVFISEDGEHTKAFDIRDGFGIIMAQQLGITFGIITGVMSSIVESRAANLGITEVHGEFRDKAGVLLEILERNELQPSQAAFIGDDLFDLPALRIAGLSAAPADAHPEIMDAVHWISAYRGGRGAVRELIELIIKARGQWDEALEKFAGG